ncbi:hypothetical protein AY599_19345 [Leptolyngbya valderiana BDU 20041]|nr:hypothetical protein AY599_19345 [Leptolyngbya valderiana BDU 20041]
MVSSLVRTPLPTHTTYTIDAIREDVRYLVSKGIVQRHEQIYELLRYVPSRDRIAFERELESHEYLLRDRIADLIPQERYQND